MHGLPDVLSLIQGHARQRNPLRWTCHRQDKQIINECVICPIIRKRATAGQLSFQRLVRCTARHGFLAISGPAIPIKGPVYGWSVLLLVRRLFCRALHARRKSTSCMQPHHSRALRKEHLESSDGRSAIFACRWPDADYKRRLRRYACKPITKKDGTAMQKVPSTDCHCKHILQSCKQPHPSRARQRTAP